MSSRPSNEDEPNRHDVASESTPLLGDSHGTGRYGAQSTQDLLSSSVHDLEPRTSIKSRRRWASALALLLLCVFVVLIMLLGFLVPESIKQYAIEATTVDIRGVVPELTKSGVRVRVKAAFSLQSSKVKNVHIRNLGVLGTWIAREVETNESKLHVTLPEYDNVLIGTAILPPLKVSIVNGRETYLDFYSDLIPPKTIDGIRAPLDNWITGSLDHLQVAGSADVAIRSGIIKLSSTTISQTISLTNSNIPAMPQFNITKLNFHDTNSTGPDGMSVDASIQIQNDFPIDLSIPSLGFHLMVNNCLPSEPKILLADAIVQHSIIRSREDVTVNTTGFVRKPSDSLIEICPQSGKSPLDTLLGGYIRGHTITIYVRGSDEQPEGTPKWLSGVLSGLTVPFPFTGHSFENVIKNFTLSDVSFGLPDPDSDSPSPQISATIKAVITLPQEMNFAVVVKRVRANADVFYKGKKIGVINLKKWQDATSTPLKGEHGEPPMLLVESNIDKAPLDITDEDTFTEIVQQLLFGKEVILLVKASVDVEIDTALGILTVQEIPAQGKVPVKPILGRNITEGLKPVIKDVAILSTTSDSISLRAIVDVHNPSNYSATIPYADVYVLVNDTFLGHATVRNMSVVPGLNTNLSAEAEWSPMDDSGRAIGRELISQYISGWNVSLSVQTHKNSIPSLPSLGKALSRIQITLPVPHFGVPDDSDDPDDEDSKPRFIKGATMHILSSTATFILSSPLTHTSLFITSLNATAFYKDDEVGTILLPELPTDDPDYDELEVPPGDSETEKLPVSWNLGSVGYEAVRKALGGTLKLNAKAEAGVRLGEWREKVWIVGGGIGAGVRL